MSRELRAEQQGKSIFRRKSQLLQGNEGSKEGEEVRTKNNLFNRNGGNLIRKEETNKREFFRIEEFARATYTSRKDMPICDKCGKAHPRKCRQGTNVCYYYGKQGHYA